MNDSLSLAMVIGIGFGIALEQAGLGNARKLIGQFYFSDFTVFKVMFTAIVTALLGVFWFAHLGSIDLLAIAVPETFLMPQFVGGLVFGAGFVICGLCPGTACAAAATGRGDGLAAMLGLGAGILFCGVAYPTLEPFYRSTAHGRWTLPEFLDLPYGVVVLIVVVIALLAFVHLERFEQRA